MKIGKWKKFFIITLLYIFLYCFSLNGADIYGYWEHYNNLTTTNETYHIEAAYKNLMRFFIGLNFDYIGFRIVTLTLTALIMFWAIDQLSPDFGVSVFLLLALYLIYTISTYRQFLTMSFTAAALVFFLKKKKLLAIILMLIGVSVHPTGIVPIALVFIVYFFRRYSFYLPGKTLFVATLAAFVVRVLYILLLHIPFLTSFLTALLGDRASVAISVVPLGLLSRLGFYVVISYLYFQKTDRDNITKFLFRIYALGCLIYFAIPIEFLMGRLMNSVLFICVILFPRIYVLTEKLDKNNGRVIDYSQSKKMRGMIVCATIVVISFATLFSQLSRQGGYAPYMNIIVGSEFDEEGKW